MISNIYFVRINANIDVNYHKQLLWFNIKIYLEKNICIVSFVD